MLKRVTLACLLASGLTIGAASSAQTPPPPPGDTTELGDCIVSCFYYFPTQPERSGCVSWCRLRFPPG